ncbi:hypothetical protein CJ030_MR6G008625 [Morella rubra]|uniref:Dirigent protein n=1 Tax=Morella rubra TaxID=262757 RepID=A0A6A1VBK6_9ROSI|nr:hypothetical protein CJ030_MR6G008625 [Morella rubra]
MAMAQKLVPKRLTNIVLALVLATTVYLAEARGLKETKLSLYVQNILAFGFPNARTIPVAGIAWTFTQFGTLYVTDHNITETPDPRSPKVGHFQGMYITAGFDGVIHRLWSR